MKILRNAVAGTLESNDVLVAVSTGGGSVQVDVESIVLEQFGPQILKAVTDVAEIMHVTDAAIRLEDRGALDCTIKARVETALRRAMEAQK